MFKIINQQIWYDNRPLGPVSCLLADYNELIGLTEADGVRHLTMPHRIDMVFAAGQRTVAVESKQSGDLESSHRNRRLARQIRTMLHEADVACLLMRWPTTWDQYTSDALLEDMVRWQALGVVLLSGPQTDSRVPETLGRYKRILAGGTNPLAAIARWDVATEGGRDRRLEGSRPGWFLQYLRGVGPRTAERLHAAFGNTAAALAATDEQWIAAGVNRGIVQRRKEAME